MKKILFLLVLALFSINLSAAYIVRHPVTLQQADGTVIHCYASGDEFYNWLHDENDYTIISNGAGYYCYAVLSGDKVVASQYVVGTVDPANVGIKPGVSISASAKKAIRDNFIKNTPERPQIKGQSAHSERENIGVMHNLVVYITFLDQSEFPQDTSYFWHLFNYDGEDNDQSLLNYFRNVSYNQFEINSHFFPLTDSSTVVSYKDYHKREYFMPYDPVTAPSGYQEWEAADREFQLLADAIEYIEDEVPDNLDIDHNNDGYVDNVVFVVRGGTTAWSTLLWPHRWSMYSHTAYINGKRVYDFNFQIEDFLISEQASVLCHEMNHSLGSPDLYRYNDNTIDPVGIWDVMAANQTPAQSMSTYMKYRYGGWVDEIPEITEGGVYTLNTPWVENNNAYKIASPNTNQEYFIVEYRNRKHRFDNKLPGEGLLIYRINPSESGNAGGPPDEVYIFRPGGRNTTTNGSLSYAFFNSEEGRTEFSDTTDPPCFLKNNAPGGIIIKNIGEPGPQISFEVWFDTEPTADVSSSTSTVTTDCSVDFKCESFVVIDNWLWEFDDATPSTSTEQNPTGIVFNSPGYKNVKLTVSNSHGEYTVVKENFIFVTSDTPPVANFYSNAQSFCNNAKIQFFDSTTLCPISWNWSFSPDNVTFEEGTTAESQNPIVSFSEPNDYTVTLHVANKDGESTITKENYITTVGMDIDGYVVDFENISSFDEIGWKVENPDNKITWKITETLENGMINQAAFVDFFNYTSVMKRDYLISPILNLDKDYKLSFRHAYAFKSSNNSDSLIISISTDCGATWEVLNVFYEDGTGNFATVPKTTSYFVPQNIDAWCGQNEGYSDCYDVDLSPYTGNSSVLIRFETLKLVGNNLFIDDIEFHSYVGIDDNFNENLEATVYPNPGNGLYTLSLDGINSQASIDVFNILGQHILSNTTNENSSTIDLTNYPSGLYIIKVSKGNQIKNLKVIKQ